MRASSILDPALEQQDSVARRAYLGTRLRETVAWAHSRSPHVRRVFDKAGIGPRDVASLDDLTKIPITRKDDVPAMQAAEPAFGGLLAVEPARLQRIFASPGPILDPQGDGDDVWRVRMGGAGGDAPAPGDERRRGGSGDARAGGAGAAGRDRRHHLRAGVSAAPRRRRGLRDAGAAWHLCVPAHGPQAGRPGGTRGG